VQTDSTQSNEVPQKESSGHDRRLDALEKVASEAAQRQRLSGRPVPPSAVKDDLEELQKVLHQIYSHFASEPQLSVSTAGEWFLDNYHVVQEALRQVREDMPPHFYRQLPAVQTTAAEPCPRIRVIAQEIIRWSNDYLVFDQVRHFIRIYQAISDLTMGELWALPAMLRLGILESLAQAAADVVGLSLPAGIELSDDGTASSEALADDRRIANCILSLRGMAAHDWNEFFESMSRVERTLRDDPAGIYARMDFETRDRYRKVVEELAKGTGRRETEIAQTVIKAADAGSGALRYQHVGYYLVDEGRSQVEARLGFRAAPWERIRRWVFHHPSWVYIGSMALFSASILIALLHYAMRSGGSLLHALGIVLIGLVPATDVASQSISWIITHTVQPRRLPSMDFDDGIPSDCRTIVVIPSMLTNQDEVESLLRQLELHYLGNGDRQLSFALLTDFADAPKEHMPDDDALIERTIAGIRALNDKYGKRGHSPFYLLHRERQWNPSEGYWMGWERKRGKLADFDRLLLGDEAEIHFTVQEGDLDALQGMRFAITLDSDTVMPRGSARDLVATMAHPLNQAEFDQQSGKVVAGYTVLQPRLEIWPAAANRSLFTQLFAGDTTVDLYTLAVSDVYQDLFGEGIYAGKGIYDIAAFERSLAGRVPMNALLSHDLFEGIHGRAGLCTTVTFYEDFPSHYLAYAFRQHRWIRGDWQLLPWLLPRVPGTGGKTMPNDLRLIDRWKIIDNLRRSLLTPTLLALFVAGWLWLPGSPLLWTLVALLMSASPVILALLGDLLSAAEARSLPILEPARTRITRWLFRLAFMAYETLLNLDAIGSTMVRLFITGRHLLQWTTAAHTVRLFKKERRLTLVWTRMGSAAVLSVGLGLLLVWLRPAALSTAAAFLLAWLASPTIADWISRPVVQEVATLSQDQLQRLRWLARRTWLYFEQFVGPDDHWLVPDHFQEDPLGQVARRTSPTNIALQLLSTLGAYDLGYIGAADLGLRLRFSFDNLTELERYRGHFLNWYDTRSLQPLPPRYVSTVDSGNLAGCLLALKRGCRDALEKPALRWQQFEGLLDELGLVYSTLHSLSDAQSEEEIAPLLEMLRGIRAGILAQREDGIQWRTLLVELAETGWPAFEHRLSQLLQTRAENFSVQTVRELRVWAERTKGHVYNMVRDTEAMLPWLRLLPQAPLLLSDQRPGGDLQEAWQGLQHVLSTNTSVGTWPETYKKGLEQLGKLRGLLEGLGQDGSRTQETLSWCDELAEQLSAAQQQSQSVVDALEGVIEEAEGYFQGMDFQFLFDRRRKVFHIGYNVTAARMDKNYYDLLASEARLASLVAVAKGDVPQSHWLHLSRSFTRINGMRVLLSWSGTMFEYLMPSLLMRSYRGSLLHQSCRAVVDRQMAYGREQGVPWGISESGYYHFDASMNYQYRAFGVPQLGLKRGLGEDLVISPYASLLALSIRPDEVMNNLQALVDQAMLGGYGLYEAIDYTASRLPPGEQSAIVRSYMAHHQGMVFGSIVNYLQDEVMVDRFHADPRVEATDLLLHEQMPGRAPTVQPHLQETAVAGEATPLPTDTPYTAPMHPTVPEVCLLSNGRYGVVISSAGGGYSQWKDLALTRWRSDTTLDDWGTWIYVQDRRHKALWSAGYQPTAVAPQWEEVVYYAHKAELRRKDQDISLRMEVTVAPDDDVEIRRLTLTNDSNRRRRLWLTSYGEVVLAAREQDLRHLAFSKLFLESEYVPELNTLLFHRRPRSPDEKPLYLAHLLVTRGRRKATGAHETDRMRFLGRGRTCRDPDAFRRGRHGLSGTVGATLDPIMCIGQNIDMLPHTSAQVAYVTLVAPTREAALVLARRYRSWLMVRRAFGRARDTHREELRQLDLSTPQLQQMQRLLSALLYPHHALRAEPATLAANRLGQSELWPFAISGDYPILLVTIKDRDQADLLYEVLRAHAYWRKRQVKIDLVILNERETGYSDELQGYLQRLVRRTGGASWLNRRGGIFILRADQLADESRVLLETAARAILRGDGGSLAQQLAVLSEEPVRLPQFVPTLSSEESAEMAAPMAPLSRPQDLLFDNGVGGFSADGREYVLYLEPDKDTPVPWINVIANPSFGFLVSECGSGYTWSQNSGENRLTPWRNDPVIDMPGEALYLRDEETAEIWSPTPQPAGAPTPYLVRHGPGYSVFEHHSHGLKQRLRLFAVRDAGVKVIQLHLENVWDRNRRITATYCAEWVLGTDREGMQQYIVPECDPDRSVLLARNTYSAEFSERVAFLATSEPLHGLTCDRTEFLGRAGSWARPAALQRLGLAGTVKAGLDPCAAAQIHIELGPGESKEIVFLLGQGADRQEALELTERLRDPAAIEAAWQAVHKFWERLLGVVQVHTPDRALDLLLNRCLLYQALACRLWARSALYQSSGAFGFRDQLQDVMALVYAAPDLARQHILRAAQHQFEAGDVLHWWHPPSGRGVRTRYSDDLLWLPYATAHYVRQTGDQSVLRVRVPFREGAALQEEEIERYGHYETTSESYRLFEHCCRALERGYTEGRHGLPLMGGGDWNDGMNRVGIKGQGESVWLGWFLCTTLTDFSALCERIGDAERAERYRQMADELAESLDGHAWDGNWYLRAYFDDGTPLGSADSPECQIASIAQSWAVLSGLANPQQATKAMEATWERLVRSQDSLVLLFTPPFDQSELEPGYVKGYPPGIRENGGQYTHAALWAAWAYAKLGQGDRAAELFGMLNPIHRAETQEEVARYKVEPYAVAADVYSHPAHNGRGGWTWYSGSAGWMYRLGLEAILGLQREGDMLRFEPCIPKDWSRYVIEYLDGESAYHITVNNPQGVSHGVKTVTLDGEELPAGEVPLLQDGKRHEVRVELG
jgi:cyclic beta-1,2-glucan synthetase